MIGDAPDMVEMWLFAVNFLKESWTWELDEANAKRRKQFKKRFCRLQVYMMMYLLLSCIALEKLVNVYRCDCGVSNFDNCVTPHNVTVFPNGTCTLELS